MNTDFCLEPAGTLSFGLYLISTYILSSSDFSLDQPTKLAVDMVVS